jgi:hypothetical protein
MTEMEMDYAGKIIEFALYKYKGIEDITHEQLVNDYWQQYFNSCTMNDKSTGMEQPHDQATWTDIFGDDDFYTLYGVN